MAAGVNARDPVLNPSLPISFPRYDYVVNTSIFRLLSNTIKLVQHLTTIWRTDARIGNQLRDYGIP